MAYVACFLPASVILVYLGSTYLHHTQVVQAGLSLCPHDSAPPPPDVTGLPLGPIQTHIWGVVTVKRRGPRGKAKQGKQ